MQPRPLPWMLSAQAGGPVGVNLHSGLRSFVNEVSLVEELNKASAQHLKGVRLGLQISGSCWWVRRQYFVLICSFLRSCSSRVTESNIDMRGRDAQPHFRS